MNTQVFRDTGQPALAIARFCLLLSASAFCQTALTAESDKLATAANSAVVKNVIVYREPGRFAGWPANIGIWNWGNGILVGFELALYEA